MADTLSLISEIAYIVSGVAFAVAVVLFFLFRIPGVIGELSGRTARRNIEKIRSANEKSGAKAYRPDAKNVERGKITEGMSKSGAKTGSLPGKGAKKATQTGKISEQTDDSTEPHATGLLAEGEDAVSGLVPSGEAMEFSSETSELDDGSSLTGTLRNDDDGSGMTQAINGNGYPPAPHGEGSEGTTELSGEDFEGTTALGGEGSEGTTALGGYGESEYGVPDGRRSVRSGVELTMLEEIIIVHTEEVIE